MIPRDIKIPIIIIDQNKAIGNTSWARRICAICSLKMVLNYFDKKTAAASITRLVKEGLKNDGYLVGVGWKHKALVKLARNRGIALRRLFAKTPAYRARGLALIRYNISHHAPVIVSMRSLRNTRGGHIVVIHGIKIDTKNTVAGYYIADPDGRGKGNRYFLSREQFAALWRGGLLYALSF